MSLVTSAVLISLTHDKTPRFESAQRLQATVQVQSLIEEKTQRVKTGNEAAAVRSHASEEVMLCRLKPKTSQQFIVTLVVYHDNDHAHWRGFS